MEDWQSCPLKYRDYYNNNYYYYHTHNHARERTHARTHARTSITSTPSTITVLLYRHTLCSDKVHHKNVLDKCKQ